MGTRSGKATAKGIKLTKRWKLIVLEGGQGPPPPPPPPPPENAGDVEIQESGFMNVHIYIYMARGRTWHYLLTSLKEVRMGRVGTPVTCRENTKSIK